MRITWRQLFARLGPGPSRPQDLTSYPDVHSPSIDLNDEMIAVVPILDSLTKRQDGRQVANAELL